jgi:hypothetical protein
MYLSKFGYRPLVFDPLAKFDWCYTFRHVYQRPSAVKWVLCMGPIPKGTGPKVFVHPDFLYPGWSPGDRTPQKGGPKVQWWQAKQSGLFAANGVTEVGVGSQAWLVGKDLRKIVHLHLSGEGPRFWDLDGAFADTALSTVDQLAAVETTSLASRDARNAVKAAQEAANTAKNAARARGASAAVVAEAAAAKASLQAAIDAAVRARASAKLAHDKVTALTPFQRHMATLPSLEAAAHPFADVEVGLALESKAHETHAGKILHAVTECATKAAARETASLVEVPVAYRHLSECVHAQGAWLVDVLWWIETIYFPSGKGFLHENNVKPHLEYASFHIAMKALLGVSKWHDLDSIPWDAP